MHLSRLVILAGAVTAAGSTLLSFLRGATTGTVGGITADGWPALLLLLPPAVAAVLGDRREGFRPLAAVLAGSLAAAATLFSVAKLLDAHAAVRTLASVGVPASVGAGAWLLAVGCVTALVGAVLAPSRRIR